VASATSLDNLFSGLVNIVTKQNQDTQVRVFPHALLFSPDYWQSGLIESLPAEVTVQDLDSVTIGS
jgi:hypothetical protein